MDRSPGKGLLQLSQGEGSVEDRSAKVMGCILSLLGRSLGLCECVTIGLGGGGDGGSGGRDLAAASGVVG